MKKVKVKKVKRDVERVRVAAALRQHIESAELTLQEARSEAVQQGIVNALRNDDIELERLGCESKGGGVTLLAYLPNDDKPVRIKVF